MAQTITVTKILAAADDDGVSASQTPSGAGNLTIAGALATGGVATLDTGRRVIITSAADDTARTFTIYGTNQDGAAQSEAVTGASGAAATSLLDFKTVTRVAVDAATAGAVKVGTNGVGATRWIAANPYGPLADLSIGTTVSGTVNYTVQYTLDADPFGFRSPTISAALKAWNVTALASKTADTDGQITFPVTAWRLQINSGAGTASARGIQQGG
jgi:hypothetical protein